MEKILKKKIYYRYCSFIDFDSIIFLFVILLFNIGTNSVMGGISGIVLTYWFAFSTIHMVMCIAICLNKLFLVLY